MSSVRSAIMSSSACTRPVLLVIAALLVYSGSTYASRLLEASLVQSEPHDLLHAGATFHMSSLETRRYPDYGRLLVCQTACWRPVTLRNGPPLTLALLPRIGKVLLHYTDTSFHNAPQFLVLQAPRSSPSLGAARADRSTLQRRPVPVTFGSWSCATASARWARRTA